MKSESIGRCAVIEALKIFSAKWKPCILCYLLNGEKRYGDLLSLIPNISKKMLTEHLKALEIDGLIHREIYPEMPPKVIYSLTEKGKSLEPVLRSLESWGLEHFAGVQSIDEMIAA